MSDGSESSLNDIAVARYAVDWELPATDVQLGEAAKAVRREYRDCSKWKRLHSHRVSVFSERGGGAVFVVHLGSSVEFDWTWEGAVAFRPRSIDDFGMLSDFALENTVRNDQVAWSGEILEVDQQNGCLFISVDDLDGMPTTGSFFVRPFEFMAVLDSVYNDPNFETQQRQLPARLAAAGGGVHPPLTGATAGGLPQLNEMWGHAWSVLWGPPGTGKTYTVGRQVASVIGDDPEERILVVSTTNKAADAVARSIGNAAKELAAEHLQDGDLIRIGKGAAFRDFANDNLLPMLQGTETGVLARIDKLAQRLQASDTMEEKAVLRKQIAELKSGTKDRSASNFLDPEARCVIATSFKAMSMLRNAMVKSLLEAGQAPFTTVIIDEAGLISRAAVAALSLLVARRVILVGDSKQLAPISKISRVVPSRQKNWLASSGVSHLDSLQQLPTAVHLLSRQFRMHPDVCQVVSNYQYGGVLKTSGQRNDTSSSLPDSIADFSRVIWYVLDSDAKDLASIRAESGPGNKSWVRRGTLSVLQKILSSPWMQQCNGLFISPYKAQAQLVMQQLAKWKLSNWEASTVHSQQGAEAGVVIFDTVNAGSCHWPFEEWKRLVNVAISRAREAVIVLASRSEMDEPYLKPLTSVLRQGVIVKKQDGYHWQDAAGAAKKGAEVLCEPTASCRIDSDAPNRMGSHFDRRAAMKPVFSREQQRLADLAIDGKPRLVRGVAGSGKSGVMSHWLAKTAQRLSDNSSGKIWAIYANRSLHRLLRQLVESAWDQLQADDMFGPQEFPWERVALLHVKDVLAGILPEASMSMERFEFDYDRAAEEFLSQQDAEQLMPCCQALFVDEAQDMGPSTLRLLLSLVEQSDPEDLNSRSAHIFYDNAQNIYGRKTPKWSEFGLDMRGRSTIMRESFRSTKPVTELAVNVLRRLSRPETRKDQQELVDLGLVERTTRNGQDWIDIRYNQIDGPSPIFQSFENRNDEIERIGKHIRYLTSEESVRPSKISVVYNGKRLAEDLQAKLGPVLAKMGIELSLQKNQPFERNDNTLVMTTSHSFKGYESEVVIIPGVDQFVTGEGDVLANNLYVAMTRARSLLAIYGTRNGSSQWASIFGVIDSCLQQLNSRGEVDASISRRDRLNDLLEQVASEHRSWFRKLWDRFEVQVEPLVDQRGAVLAQPMFWVQVGGIKYAYAELPHDVGHIAEITWLRLGQDPPAS